VSCDEDDNQNDEDDEDGEDWEDVDDDEEEEEEGDSDDDDDEEDEEEEGSVEEVEIEVEGEKKVVVVKKDIRQRVDATRILTAEDFQLLERLRLAQAERAMNPKNRSKNSAMQKTQERKRQREEDEEEDNDHGPQFAVNPSSLGAGMKTGKTSKIDRITHILEGRKESKFEHNGHAGKYTYIYIYINSQVYI
jgi:predicted ribonuclease YlaK